MRIGFLDSIFNYADVYEEAAKVLEERIPAVSLERMTVPHLLKIPLFSKLLLKNNCDAVVVFLTMLEEDASELDLVHEKVIDLEVEEGRPVYFCIIADSEFKDQEELVAVMAPKLGFIAEAVAKLVASPSGLSSDIANQDLTSAMSMFGGTAIAAEGQNETGSDLDAPDLGGAGEGKSLF